MTPLLIASRNGHLEVVQALLASGLNLNIEAMDDVSKAYNDQVLIYGCMMKGKC